MPSSIQPQKSTQSLSTPHCTAFCDSTWLLPPFVFLGFLALPRFKTPGLGEMFQRVKRLPGLPTIDLLTIAGRSYIILCEAHAARASHIVSRNSAKLALFGADHSSRPSCRIATEGSPAGTASDFCGTAFFP
jgi:hypothetical protein